jgi:hypothetical protein
VYARGVHRTLTLGLLLLALGPAAAAGDGGPVRSFGAGGAVSFAPQRFSSGAGVIVDAQGRTLVGATLDDGSLLRTRAAVLRLLPDGVLDPSFGSGGAATIAPPAPTRPRAQRPSHSTPRAASSSRARSTTPCPQSLACWPTERSIPHSPTVGC